MLAEGKAGRPALPAGRYVKYALGEILLVVVGILIALQVNNWNVNLRLRALEEQSLKNLKIDLALQKEIIQEQLDFEGEIMGAVDSCFMLLVAKMDVGTLDVLLERLSERKTFVENRVTFESLRSMGESSLITNADLRNEIVRYYQSLDYTRSVINNNNLLRVNSQFGTFVVNNVLGLRLDEEGNLDLNYKIGPEQRFTLKKQLEGRKYSSTNNVEKCHILMDRTRALIELIDIELK